MAHKLNRYADTVRMEEIDTKWKNWLRYIAMAFRPAGVLLFCVTLTLLVSILCIIVIVSSESNTSRYGVALAILTGVIASGLVSISIELANNYRRNRQRFVFLNEYLYIVSSYEQFIEWASHGNYMPFSEEALYGTNEISWDEPQELLPRVRAVSEIILEIGTVIEKAVLTGKEYMTIKELQLATQAVDAADKLGEITNDIVFEHLESKNYSVYDMLSEPLRSKIKDFSEDVGIFLQNEDLNSVVCDYVLSNLDSFGIEPDSSDKLQRDLIINCLRDFDTAMSELRLVAALEPVLYDNLELMSEKMKKDREKYGF